MLAAQTRLNLTQFTLRLFDSGLRGFCSEHVFQFMFFQRGQMFF